MEFRKIEDLTDWNRKQAYEHFTHNVKNTITLTADIDVTNVVVQCKEKQLRFYASFIHLVSAAVNKFDEFKMGYDEQGNAGIWQNVSPSYTMFHDEDHSFHNLYTAYDPSFATFYKNAVGDIEANRDTAGIDWSNTPRNLFYISCIPWMYYKDFSLQMYNERPNLEPIITWGKYQSINGRLMLPFTIQISHAAAVGYHISQLYAELQQLSNDFCPM
ncbi:CatA-like O-acetyltransferase [Enterococcus malodoratus]|uniref:Chloramphenicol acetyltransferase n=1 Tax=Enterococcus malodoratus ATCC 43197 TaxID=1158601 RepID=R2NW07_9ENTE|nr:chloramphenicol acetyltransferase CAT [Enterococcus malodoratus]EOH75193.1 hypothetical protein UAI_02995 [Enterococcus malodoratus ATCC 43197]EOT66655.1 hypothetical protein I585_02176 [Enterococcus malodoratus ATCC 43197]OJG66052.1 hypothetical protein RV07_GL001639 [Enterococcus malodoratus]SPW90677.1 chloramphenicol O-acetyltransferase [Enterococcus malodoratus]STD70092.1 chloramphenicol O-acetyltransferase [Enterococcus malodoratus]